MPRINAITISVPELMESTVLRVGATINTIGSVANRIIFAPMKADIIGRIETFSQSHPRVIQTLEPTICSLIRFLHNHPELFRCSLIILVVVAQTFSAVLWYFALPETTGVLIMGLLSIFSILFPFLLGGMVFKELVKKHIDQAIDINKLTESFLNLPPKFVAALNEWTRNESQKVDSQWREARKKIIKFYNFPDRFFSLARHNLHSLPNVFDHPYFRNKLKMLLLNKNHLTRLPESIGNLQSLDHLYLANNPELAGLSSAILQLPPTCLVDITNCNFSATVLARIREITREPDYTGPRISHSMQNLGTAPSIEQSLRTFYRVSGRNYNRLPELKKLPNLRLWLHKLTWLADFRGRSQPAFVTKIIEYLERTNEDNAFRKVFAATIFNWLADFRGRLQQAFVTKIIEYLERANEDSAFRKVFAATIFNATETCEGKVALSVLNLGISYKLSTIDLNNMHELYHLLTRGVLALDLLQDIARKKIPTLRMFDEIEVYLGYPVKLKDALNLPIDIENMLYFECTALSPQDLEDAKNSVLNSLSSEDMRVAFLKTQPKWIDALKMNFPEEMERLAENPDIAEEGLINLTREIIQSFNS